MARIVSAQSSAAYVPLIGLGVGATELPKPLVETCGGNPRTLPTFEVSGGVSGDHWKLEGRATIAHQGVVADCLSVKAAHESGVHTDRVYGYRRRHGDTSLSAHVQYAPPAAFWFVGVGAGRLLGSKVPFVLGSGGLRTRGRFSVAVEVQGRLSRLNSHILTAEWANYQVTSELRRDPEGRWHRTDAIRLRAELLLR
jgi:hypothetical protein